MKQGLGKQGPGKPDDKAERLAAALRENLKRRKAQERGSAEIAGEGKDPVK